jgi:hypothetical protein
LPDTNTTMSGLDGSMRLAQTTTLDEPVMTTIMRDLNQVGDKLKVVLLPLGKDAQDNVLEKLRDCKYKQEGRKCGGRMRGDFKTN